MSSDILNSLIGDLKLMNCAQNEDYDVANSGKGYSAEIRKWKSWINSQEIEPLPRRRAKVKDLIESIPPGTDWHVVTGFDVTNISTLQAGRSTRPNRSMTRERDSIRVEDAKDVSNENLADVSSRQEAVAASSTSSPQTVSMSTVTDPTVPADETVDGTLDQASTLKQLIEEQKKLQAALRRDMKSQEEQFKEQYSKLAEQQRRLTERDAMRELMQQQMLMQQLQLAASQPPPGVAPGLFPSHLTFPATLQSMSPAASYSLSSNQAPPPPTMAAAFQTAAPIHPMVVPPTQYQPVHAPPLNHPIIPTFPSSGMRFPNAGPDYLSDRHEDLSTSSQWNPSDVQTKHHKFSEQNTEAANTSRRGLKDRNTLSASELASTKMTSSSLSKQAPLSAMQKLLAAQLMSDASDEEFGQFGAGPSRADVTNKSERMMTSSINYGVVSSSTSNDVTLTGAGALGVSCWSEWAATLNNPGNGRRWEIMIAVMKGWLVRRLMRTEKVQVLITTIRDARDFLANLRYAEEEFPGMTDAKDAQLQQRVISQLRAAIFDLHHVFFELPMRAKLDLIAASRKHLLNKRLHGMPGEGVSAHSSRDMNISSATLKARERKQKEGTPRTSEDSTPREKKTPKRVDCGLRGGYLPKRDPPQPVKLDPRKYYSKHALSRPRSAGGVSARSSSRDSSVTSSIASSVARTGDAQQHQGSSSATTSTPNATAVSNTGDNTSASRGRHEKRRNADMVQK